MNCAVCDGSFFPSLLNEMSAVVGFFNQKAQKLLEYHLASGFRKYLLLFKGKPQGNHVALIQEGKDLVTYALINAIAIRKILKKYDKVYKHTIQEYVMVCIVVVVHDVFDEIFWNRFITQNKGRPLSHKRKVCILEFFKVHGFVSLWLFTSI